MKVNIIYITRWSCLSNLYLAHIQQFNQKYMVLDRNLEICQRPECIRHFIQFSFVNYKDSFLIENSPMFSPYVVEVCVLLFCADYLITNCNVLKLRRWLSTCDRTNYTKTINGLHIFRWFLVSFQQNGTWLSNIKISISDTRRQEFNNDWRQNVF